MKGLHAHPRNTHPINLSQVVAVEVTLYFTLIATQLIGEVVLRKIFI